ncbi:hypothetical protein AXFE_09610 [Acidithrix ferrooxidans]|uniref:Uncharacterized protein n=1 Tax=Acidithrix ferrooxidans TaxID=1280514 RepID=A0A0D8HJT4_9ACTN|nr:hypothetical protein AXFE_09610 [Acidithrix ferrooxidans]
MRNYTLHPQVSCRFEHLIGRTSMLTVAMTTDGNFINQPEIQTDQS